MIGFIVGMMWLGLILGVIIMPVVFLFDEKKIKEIKRLIEVIGKERIKRNVDENLVFLEVVEKSKYEISKLQQGLVSGYYKRKARDLISLI